MSVADKWILNKLNLVTKEVTANLESYELGVAAQKLYDFVWSEFCDWYIEFSKPVLYGTDEQARNVTISVLNYCLDKILKLLHPFVPFLTEAIYQSLPGHEETIMLSQYPVYSKDLEFGEDADTLDLIKEIIKSVRNAKAEMNVAPSKRISMFIRPSQKAEQMKNAVVYIEKLAGAEKIVFVDETATFEQVVSLVSAGGEVFIPLGELVDKQKEIDRLTKEVNQVNSEIKRAEGKLNNQGFVAKAPASLIEQEKEKLAKYKDMLTKLNERIEELKKL